MKKTLTILTCLVGMVVASCSQITNTAPKTKGEVVYNDGFIAITRVWINGLPYLANSQGGIILEASEAEYGALVDSIEKDGSK